MIFNIKSEDYACIKIFHCKIHCNLELHNLNLYRMTDKYIYLFKIRKILKGNYLYFKAYNKILYKFYGQIRVYTFFFRVTNYCYDYCLPYVCVYTYISTN